MILVPNWQHLHELTTATGRIQTTKIPIMTTDDADTVTQQSLFRSQAPLPASPCPAFPMFLAFPERGCPQPSRAAPGDAERSERALSPSESCEPGGSRTACESSFIGTGQSAQISLDTNSRWEKERKASKCVGGTHSPGWPRAGVTGVSHRHKITPKKLKTEWKLFI